METKDVEPLDLERYNWDISDGEAMEYHIMDYMVKDGNGDAVTFVTLLQCFNEAVEYGSTKYTLFGQLLPVVKSRTLNSKELLGIQTDIIDYEISIDSDPCLVDGCCFCFIDTNNARYKVEPPYDPELKQILDATFTQSSHVSFVRSIEAASLRDQNDVDSSMILAGIKQVRHLRGQLLLSDNKTNDQASITGILKMKVKASVNTYRMHLGSVNYIDRARGDSKAVGREVRCVADLDETVFLMGDTRSWYKLLSFDPDYLPTAEMTLKRTIGSMAEYNWAASATGIAGAAPDEDEVWRHVGNYSITNQAGELKRPDEVLLSIPANGGNMSAAALAAATLDSAFILIGVLKPSKRSSSPPVNVEVLINGYAIDYGLTRRDLNRGLWVKDVHDNWYKLDSPCAPEYAAHAEIAENKCQKFLALYDVLEDCCVYSADRSSMHYSKTVQTLLKQSNNAFDLDFVRGNKQYVLQHLPGSFDFKKSVPFTKSIQELAECVKKGKTATAVAPTPVNVSPDKAAKAEPSVKTNSKRVSSSSSVPSHEAEAKPEDLFLNFLDNVGKVPAAIASPANKTTDVPDVVKKKRGRPPKRRVEEVVKHDADDDVKSSSRSDSDYSSKEVKTSLKTAKSQASTITVGGNIVNQEVPRKTPIAKKPRVQEAGDDHESDMEHMSTSVKTAVAKKTKEKETTSKSLPPDATESAPLWPTRPIAPRLSATEYHRPSTKPLPMPPNTPQAGFQNKNQPVPLMRQVQFNVFQPPPPNYPPPARVQEAPLSLSEVLPPVNSYYARSKLSNTASEATTVSQTPPAIVQRGQLLTIPTEHTVPVIEMQRCKFPKCSRQAEAYSCSTCRNIFVVLPPFCREHIDHSAHLSFMHRLVDGSEELDCSSGTMVAPRKEKGRGTDHEKLYSNTKKKETETVSEPPRSSAIRASSPHDSDTRYGKDSKDSVNVKHMDHRSHGHSHRDRDRFDTKSPSPHRRGSRHSPSPKRFDRNTTDRNRHDISSSRRSRSRTRDDTKHRRDRSSSRNLVKDMLGEGKEHYERRSSNHEPKDSIRYDRSDPIRSHHESHKNSRDSDVGGKSRGRSRSPYSNHKSTSKVEKLDFDRGSRHDRGNNAASVHASVIVDKPVRRESPPLGPVGRGRAAVQPAWMKTADTGGAAKASDSSSQHRQEKEYDDRNSNHKDERTKTESSWVSRQTAFIPGRGKEFVQPAWVTNPPPPVRSDAGNDKPPLSTHSGLVPGRTTVSFASLQSRAAMRPVVVVDEGEEDEEELHLKGTAAAAAGHHESSQLPVCGPSKTFLERFFHDVQGRMRLTDGSNDKACKYCRSVYKKRKCTDKRHRHGHEYDDQKKIGK